MKKIFQASKTSKTDVLTNVTANNFELILF